MTPAPLKGLVFVLLALSALLLGGAFWLAGWPWGALPVVGVAGVWALGMYRQNGRFTPQRTALLAALLALSGAGALLLAPAVLVWGYLGGVGVLAAWDLSGFYGRVARAPHVIDPARFITAHLRRLGLLLAVALLGPLSVRLIPLDFIFDRTLLLALLLVLSLGFLVRRIRDEW